MQIFILLYLFEKLNLTFDILVELFLKNSSYVSGVSVCISVALWVCVFGFLLQEPVRLNVLWVDS